MKTRVIITAAVAVMLIPAFSMAGDVVIIGNSTLPTSTISKKEIIRIFLGKKIVWDDKTKIVITLRKNSDTHRAFLKEYIHKSPTQFAGIWKRRIFTGMGLSPKTFDSDKETVKYVRETKGAVGYVSTGTSLDDVKTINIK